MGRISAGGETCTEMPNSPQGLNRHHKALSQGLGSQIPSAGVAPFNLKAIVFSIELELSNQIGKASVFVLHSAICAREQKCELCRYPLSMPKHSQNNYQMVVKVTHKRISELHTKQAKIKLLSHR